MNEALKYIYNALPTLQCQGKCHQSCGPIGLFPLEVENLRSHEIPIPSCNAELTCSALVENRCSIYENRPMICRLWGLTPRMPCPHGCQPERWLSDEDAMSFMKLLRLLKQGKSVVTIDRAIIKQGSIIDAQ